MGKSGLKGKIMNEGNFLHSGSSYCNYEVPVSIYVCVSSNYWWLSGNRYETLCLVNDNRSSVEGFAYFDQVSNLTKTN